MFNGEVEFGFKKSVIDGSERIFGTAQASYDMPKTYSYKRFLPSVINQGTQPICVPCSVSAYLNWRENLSTGTKEDNGIDLLEIYASKKYRGDGMTFKDAFHFLRHHGVGSKLGVLQIKEYAMVKSFMALKAAIVMNGPCLGALPVYNDREQFWNKMSGDSLHGYHAISIVGYNNDGFIIRNSWGTGFGDRGYTLIRYEDFDKFVEVWTILD